MKTKQNDKPEASEPGSKIRIMRGWWIQMILAIVVVGLGIAGAFAFIKLKKPPQRVEQAALAPLVKVERLRVTDIPMVVRGHGTVSPNVEVDIIPEVAGKVVNIHPELKVGGLIRANERILEIDPRDYELAVQQAEAAVADARVRLDTERAEAEVARKEWSQLHPGTEPSSSLVLREPQIRKAEATLKSAEAQLDTAKLKLERTVVSFPFDVLITSESVDLGQFVVIGQSLAKAYGTDAVEIEVPLDDNELAWFDVFDNSIFVGGDPVRAQGTPAKVRADFAGAEQTWQGRVVRTRGQVDKNSRMISIIVEVPDPFKVREGRPPLLPGVFAEVLIQGKTLCSALAVPRDAIREGSRVWLVNDDRLHIKTLDIARADKNFAYVVSDASDEVDVIVSSLDAVVDGMKVRVQSDARTDGEGKAQDPRGPAER